VMERMVTGRGSEELQDVHAQLGAYSDGLVRDTLARWQRQYDMPGVRGMLVNAPGRVSSMGNTFFNLSLIHHVYDSARAAFKEMLANNLARNVGKAFDELQPHLRQMLGKYGFTPETWDLLRQHGELSEANGRKYMTPRAAGKLDEAAAEAHLRKQGVLNANSSADDIEREVIALRSDLADKLGSYYADAAAHSVVTPGAKERSVITGFGKRGSFSGELARYVGMFKMWPAAAMTQILGREIHMSLSSSERAFNIGALLAFSALGGYMRMTANDLATGRPVRNPMDPNTLLAAVAQGGGLGIYGDYLFGETNRMGASIWSSALGPVAADVEVGFKIYNRFRQDEFSNDPKTREKALQHMWPDLAHFAVKHIPAANLFYLKGALDYMLWYHLYEAASPGWWDRTNKRLIKEQGRPMAGYTGPHSQIPWTPFGWGHETATGGEAGPTTAAPSGGRGVAEPRF